MDKIVVSCDKCGLVPARRIIVKQGEEARYNEEVHAIVMHIDLCSRHMAVFVEKLINKLSTSDRGWNVSQAYRAIPDEVGDKSNVV